MLKTNLKTVFCFALLCAILPIGPVSAYFLPQNQLAPKPEINPNNPTKNESLPSLEVPLPEMPEVDMHHIYPENFPMESDAVDYPTLEAYPLPEEPAYFDDFAEDVSPQREIIPPSAETVALTQEQVRSFDCSTVTDVPEIECEALVAFYQSTNGAGWTDNTNWLSSTTVINWFGIDVWDNHVITTELQNNQLSGQIPLELDNLISLEFLNLQNNYITGNIPTVIGSLSNLRVLALSNNQLTGNIPTELGNQSNFKVLFLNNNQLSGAIPENLINLVNLDTLDISYNYLNITGYSTELISFLNGLDPDWASTQIAPFTGCDDVTEIPSIECQALEVFYTATNGTDWDNNTNWLENNRPSTWYGVSVTSGHVEAL